MTKKHNENQQETYYDAHSLSPPSPAPPPPVDLPFNECDPNVIIESSDMCGKTFHENKDIVNNKFDNHIHSIDDRTCMLNHCTNIAHSYFKSVKLLKKNKQPYKHLLICDTCTGAEK